MPNLDTIAAQDWLRALQPGQALPDWPPPIRAIEEPSHHARALIDLGDELDQCRGAGDNAIRALLDDPAALEDLRSCLCQLGAARLLTLMHFLSESQDPIATPPAILLSNSHTPEAAALGSALRMLSRRFTLHRMFSPERLSALRTAIADANKEALQ
jgi:hypothetical protein